MKQEIYKLTVDALLERLNHFKTVNPECGSYSICMILDDDRLIATNSDTPHFDCIVLDGFDNE